MRLKVIKIFLNKIPILNDNLINLILKEYWNLLPKKKILKNLIPLSKLDWDNLSSNKNAINLLKNNPKKINWYFLSGNINAIDLLKKKLKKFIGIICLVTKMQFQYWKKI